MKIAIPVAEGKLCMHFGHCEVFAIVEVDPDAKTIIGTELLTPPPHEPGVLPPWVAEQGAKLVIAGGMGGRAIQLFQQAGVQVVTGAPAVEPEKVIMDYLNTSLITGDNACGHGPDHVCDH